MIRRCRLLLRKSPTETNGPGSHMLQLSSNAVDRQNDTVKSSHRDDDVRPNAIKKRSTLGTVIYGNVLREQQNQSRFEKKINISKILTVLHTLIPVVFFYSVTVVLNCCSLCSTVAEISVSPRKDDESIDSLEQWSY